MGGLAGATGCSASLAKVREPSVPRRTHGMRQMSLKGLLACSGCPESTQKTPAQFIAPSANGALLMGRSSAQEADGSPTNGRR